MYTLLIAFLYITIIVNWTSEGILVYTVKTFTSQPKGQWFISNYKTNTLHPREKVIKFYRLFTTVPTHPTPTFDDINLNRSLDSLSFTNHVILLFTNKLFIH